MVLSSESLNKHYLVSGNSVSRRGIGIVSLWIACEVLRRKVLFSPTVLIWGCFPFVSLCSVVCGGAADLGEPCIEDSQVWRAWNAFLSLTFPGQVLSSFLADGLIKKKTKHLTLSGVKGCPCQGMIVLLLSGGNNPMLFIFKVNRNSFLAAPLGPSFYQTLHFERQWSFPRQRCWLQGGMIRS